MGVIAGTNMPKGLVFFVDPGNRKSDLYNNTQETNILAAWRLYWGESTTGGVSGYGANGSASEQSRGHRSNDPWGSTSWTWRSTPDATSGADGGWNSSYYSIDTSYTYRWSVWVKRYTSGTGGTFYLGMNPAPIRNDNNAVQSNPYWHCPSISSLALNQWYLVVGHCFYEGYAGGRHPNSGYWYKDSNGVIQKTDLGFCNCGDQDVRWNPGTTTAMHRSYHYYTTNTASGIEWSSPRVDKCDGTEPTIGEIMNQGEGQIVDMVNGHRLTLGQGTSTRSGGDGNAGVVTLYENSEGYMRNSTFNLASSDNTVIYFGRKYSSSGDGRMLTALNNNWLLGFHDTTYGDYFAEGWVYGGTGTSADNTWRMYTGTGNLSTDQWSVWINDQKIATNNGGSQGPNGWNINSQYSQYSFGQIGAIMAWNRVLSDDEIRNVYRIMGKKHGLS